MRKLAFLVTVALLFSQQTKAQKQVWAEDFDGILPPMNWAVNPWGSWIPNTVYYLPGTSSMNPASYMGLVPNQTNSTTILQTPTYNCVYGYVYLRFSHICKVSPADTVSVEYRIVPSSNWLPLPASSYIGQAANYNTTGFNAASYPEWQAGNISAIPANSWWKEEVFNLSFQAAYGMVQFRFVIKRGNVLGTQASYGWLIENFVLETATFPSIPPTVQFVQPYVNGTVYNIGPFEINAKVKSNTSALIVPPQLTVIDGMFSNNIMMAHVQGDSLWKAYIPQYPAGTIISYSITGMDTFGNTAMASSYYTIAMPSDVGTIYGNNSVAAHSIGVPDTVLALPSMPVPIYATIKNKGYLGLNNVTISYTVNGGPVNTISPTIFPPLPWDFNYSVMLGTYQPTTYGFDFITVWVKSPNGQYDTVTYDDTIHKLIYGRGDILMKYVQSPTDTVYYTGSYNVEAKIESLLGAIGSVFLFVASELGGVTTYDTLLMQPQGNDIWTTQIQSKPIGTTVVYTIKLVDIFSNTVELSDSCYVDNGNAVVMHSVALLAVQPDLSATANVLTPIRAIIHNMGKMSLTTCGIAWKLNGGNTDMGVYNMNVPKYLTDTITIGYYTPSTNKPDTILVYVFMPNGMLDPITQDDTLTVFPMGIVHATGISLNKKQIRIDAGDSTSIFVSIVPLNATNQNISIVNTNPSIAHITDTMLYTLSGGTTHFIFTTADGGFKDTCSVVVTGLVNGCDLAVLQIQPLGNEVLNNQTVSVDIEVANNGTVTINSATFGWAVNGVIQQTSIPYTFSPPIPSLGQQLIQIGTFTANASLADSFIVTAWVENVNGIPDSVSWNNTVSKTYSIVSLVEYVQPTPSGTLINKLSFEVYAKIYAGTGAPQTTPQLSITTKGNGYTMFDIIPMMPIGNVWVAQIPQQYYGSKVIYSLAVSDSIGNSSLLTDSVYLTFSDTGQFETYLFNNLTLLELLPSKNETAVCVPVVTPVRVVLANTGSNNYDFTVNSIVINYQITDPTQTMFSGTLLINTDSLASGKTDTVELLSIFPIPNGTSSIKAWVTSSIDMFSLDDTVNYTYTSMKIGIPFDETFNTTLPYELMSEALLGTNKWEVYHPNISYPVQPNTGGMLRFAGTAGEMTLLTTKQIDLWGTIMPNLEFWYYHDAMTPEQDNSYTELRIIADNVTTVGLTALKRDMFSGWAKYVINLSPYTMAQCVFIQIESMNKLSGQTQYIDRIHITSEHDLEVSEVFIKPYYTCNLSSSVYVVIRNTTNQGISFSQYPTSLAVNISGQPPVYYPLTSGGIIGNTSDTILVIPNLSFTKGMHTITASITPSIDANPFNDTARTNLVINPVIKLTAFKLTDGVNCLLKATTVQQAIKIENTGNMDISDIAIVMQVTGASIQTIYDTLHTTLAAGSDTTINLNYTTPSVGIYAVNIIAYMSCDSILVRDSITLMECIDMNDTSVITQITDTICENVPYYFGGNLLTISDIYYDTLQSVHGYDSIVELTLTVHPVYLTQINDTISAGNSYNFFEKQLNESGIYYDTLQTVFGCDSIFELTLMVGSVGINQLPIMSKQLLVYPNPTNGKFIIYGSQFINIEIFDIVGRVVGTNQHVCPEQQGEHIGSPKQDDIITIDISHLSNGMYFLKVDGKVYKVVKN
jgi:hypothetical protein